MTDVFDDPMATDEQRALMASLKDLPIAATMAKLFQRSSAVIDDAQLDDAAPVSRKSGAQIRAILVRQYEHTVDSDPMLMLTVMVTGSVRQNVVGLDATSDGKSCVVHLGENAALLRCDLRYKMNEADKKKIKEAKDKLKKKMKANKANGLVPAGVVPICSGQIFLVTLYGVNQLRVDGEPVAPGAEINLIGVTANFEYTPGMRPEQVLPALRAAACQVVSADEQSGVRHANAFESSCVTSPIMQGMADGMSLPKWPEQMLVPTDELPDAQPAAAGQLVVANGNSSDAPSSDVITPSIPARPYVFLRVKSPVVVLHIGESKASATVRAAAMPEGIGSVMTVTSAARPSNKKDAFVFTKDGKDEEFVHAKFSLIVTQQCRNREEVSIIYVQAPADSDKSHAMTMLTGTPVVEMQKVAARALVHGLRGALCLEPKPAAIPECTIEGLEKAMVYESYINSIPVSVLANTVPVAGFRVSYNWIAVQRGTVASPDALAKQMQNQSLYYRVAGQPSLNSDVLLLNTTKYGFYDDDSNAACAAAMAEMGKALPSKKQAKIAELLPKLTGPLTKLRDGFGFFVVGRYCMTPDVIEHQRELARTDLAALMRGNEELITDGRVPPGWPAEIYQEMMIAVPANARYLQYAVSLKIVDGVVELERMKRQVEEISERGKRKAIEGPAGGAVVSTDSDTETIDV